ncbi:MAG: hypothetical protein WBY47_05370 [Desulfobacterales bacterium]
MMKKNKKQYVLELDGLFYHLKDSRLRQIADLKEVNDAYCFVTDLQETISRTMTVEAPAKYAEFVVRKKLQESGDFDEPVSVITHWKKKRGKNTTDIFFTALPTRQYHVYLEKIRTSEDGILMIPLYTLLYNVLKQMHSEDPIAVIFQHGRFADVIVGNKSHIYYSNRCVAFDKSEAQISVLWDTVRTDIQTAQTENGMKVKTAIQLSWIDSGENPEWTENEEYEWCHLEEEPISFDDDTYLVSFLNAIRRRSGNGAITPKIEKLYYHTQKWAAPLNIFLLVFLLAITGGYFLCRNRADLVEKQLKRMNRQITGLSADISMNAIPAETYRDTFEFIKDLSYCKNSPSYLDVMNDVTKGLSSDMETEILKIDYSADAMTLEIFGRIQADFDSAHNGYQEFISFMKSKGYSVTENRFDTNIRESKYLAKFTKRIG